MKMKALSWSFSLALLLRVVSQYCLGILWDWHIFTWFFIWGNYNNAAIAGENWFWVIEWTPAFIGSGILVGLNTAISFVVGEILGYGIIGPALVHNRIAFGEIRSVKASRCGVLTIPQVLRSSTKKPTEAPRRTIGGKAGSTSRV